MTVNDSIKENGLCRRFRILWNHHRKPFLILYIYTVILYLPMLVLRLTNDMDGLWGQDDYLAGVWELSIGRWFWPYLDRARFGISLDPLPGLAALILYVSGFLMVADMLGFNSAVTLNMSGKATHRDASTCLFYLSGALFLASTGITCQMSYSYMVITFAVSFFLAILPVKILYTSLFVYTDPLHPLYRGRLLQRGRALSMISRVLLCGLIISVMMGCYQSSIGVTAVVSLFVFLHILACGPTSDQNGERTDRINNVHDAGRSTVRSHKNFAPAILFARNIFFALCIGAVFYEILLHLHYSLFHTEPASYQGFASITPAYIIQNLPRSIRHTYTALKAYWLGRPFQFHALVTRRWFVVFYIFPAAAALTALVRVVKKDRICGILFAAGLLLIPLFANCFFLLAPDAETQMQTTVPMSLILPLLLTMAVWEDHSAVDRQENPSQTLKRNDTWHLPMLSLNQKKNGGCRILFTFYIFACCFLIYGAAGQVEIDSYAMYAGRRASETLAKSIVSGMQAAGQDYLAGQVLIIGSPADSRTFPKTDLFERANDYAKYGTWPEDIDTSRICWSRLFANALRMNLSYVVQDTGETVEATPEAAAMPVFPAPGSIQNIYGVTVVKLK